MPYASAGLGTRWLAATLGLLLLLAVGFQLTLYGLLSQDNASPPVGATSVSPERRVQAAGPLAPFPLPIPVVAGDARWGVGADTYCETFVEQEAGLGNQGATAFAAYLRLAGLDLVHGGPPPAAGDLVYFAPAAANGFDGHVGIFVGDGQFISVTDRGVQTMPLAGWDAPYLGWVRPADVRTDRFGSAVSPG